MQWLLRISLVRVVLLLGLVLFFVFSPYDFRETARKKREHYTQQTSTPMEIAIVWPQANQDFFQGAALAVREINSRGGITIAGASGTPVKTPIVMHEYDEFAYPNIETLADQIGKNLNLSAVIGHSDPDLAIRASITYRDSCLLYISPSVSDMRLAEYGFWTTVQTIPKDPVISRAMVAFALKHGWQKAAILYVRNTYGITYDSLLRASLGEMFVRPSPDTKEMSALELVFEGHYAEDEQSFYALSAQLLRQKCDCVFLADSLIGKSRPRTLALIRQLREMGVKQPILGTEEIHSDALWPALGQQANDIFAANIFDLQSVKSNRIAQDYQLAFRTLYTNTPSMQASKAYEAIMLLAQAAERAQSKLPIRMATMFRSTPNWNGLQGEGAYDFSQDGGIQKKNVIMDQMKDGIFISPEIPEVCLIYTNTVEQPMKNRRD